MTVHIDKRRDMCLDMCIDVCMDDRWIEPTGLSKLVKGIRVIEVPGHAYELVCVRAC